MSIRVRVIVWVLGLFTAGFLVDAAGQASGKFDYQFPPELLEFSRMAVTAALGTDIFLAVRGHFKKPK